MSTLNIVNKSPLEKRSLEQCLLRSTQGDSVLLIEDACVAAIQGNAGGLMLADHANGLDYFVLKPDLAARGFADAQLVPGVSVVDYAGFVDLVVQYDQTHSWL